MIAEEKPKHIDCGVLVISLDFELCWGVRNFRGVDGYMPNLLGVYRLVPALLDMFSRHEIHATWATVGLIACSGADEALENAPTVLPEYRLAGLSPYDYLRDSAGQYDEKIHFAPGLVQQVADANGQEIATHTFSHYYCLEEGQSLEAFEQDLVHAIRLFEDKYGVRPKSIVFPRNQYSQRHIDVCGKLGLLAYRGAERGWWNTPRACAKENLLHRAVRLADSYLAISGYHLTPHFCGQVRAPMDIPASRLLRSCPKNHLLERLQKKRIEGEMYRAARQKKLYHLWWHPHNFGADVESNLNMLEDILRYFSLLRSGYGMRSMSMEEYASVSL